MAFSAALALSGCSGAEQSNPENPELSAPPSSTTLEQVPELGLPDLLNLAGYPELMTTEAVAQTSFSTEQSKTTLFNLASSEFDSEVMASAISFFEELQAIDAQQLAFLEAPIVLPDGRVATILLEVEPTAVDRHYIVVIPQDTPPPANLRSLVQEDEFSGYTLINPQRNLSVGIMKHGPAFAEDRLNSLEAAMNEEACNAVLNFNAQAADIARYGAEVVQTAGMSACNALATARTFAQQGVPYAEYLAAFQGVSIDVGEVQLPFMAVAEDTYRQFSD